ncbi:nickel pincer cofactor biosynthesis protein LarC [Geobacter sp. DSM 9736]|uniref:nickel pincer cofactor biosynthesis protein LarC n=1 Tax=Geobacter sp. DSM 9736 TaxID=1277350 RepID=UPI000B512EE6|nr:nickel pincer cofactor biosynthesis protein LarC [Geobacter sp. DSM 9736]SNB47210.1 hypothetical protein SAMN06269301_2688 [Geobacter sp. DSM 9736]
MNILYFDCLAGIAGDMTIAALVDLGVPFPLLREQLALLPLDASSYRLHIKQVERRHVTALHFDVEVSERQHHRHYSDIDGMIRKSLLPENVKYVSLKIFRRLAEAEAKVHGVGIEDVHFHEVGAIDSIIDVVGTAICLDHLGAERIYTSPLPYGSGFVETAHGRLPVPAPATAELLRGMAVHFDIGAGERVTPTGAAILAELAESVPPPAMHIKRVGCGAGTKDFSDVPNVLRVVSGEVRDVSDDVFVMETHIDDMNPEVLGFLMEHLLASGALDVAFSPLQMKKNRPGVRLTIICGRDKRDELAREILHHSTAIGVRYYPVERAVLERASEERETSLGPVRVKVTTEAGTVVRIAPEFEECRRIAEERGMPLIDVYRIIERETGGQ